MDRYHGQRGRMHVDFSTPHGRRQACHQLGKLFKKRGLPVVLVVSLFALTIIPIIINIFLWLVVKVLLLVSLIFGYKIWKGRSGGASFGGWSPLMRGGGGGRRGRSLSPPRQPEPPQAIQTDSRLLSLGSVSLKLRNATTEETRRLTMETSNLTKEGVEYQLQLLFPEATYHDILLHYMDEDSDRITIGTEAEFVDACVEMLARAPEGRGPIRFLFTLGAEKDLALNVADIGNVVREAFGQVKAKIETLDGNALLTEVGDRINRLIGAFNGEEPAPSTAADSRSPPPPATSYVNHSTARHPAVQTASVSTSIPVGSIPTSSFTGYPDLRRRSPQTAQPIAEAQAGHGVVYPVLQSARVPPPPPPYSAASSTAGESVREQSVAPPPTTEQTPPSGLSLSAEQDWESILEEIHNEDWTPELAMIKQVLPSVDEQRCLQLLRQHDGDVGSVVDELLSGQ